VLPHEWESHHAQIRKTYQALLMKVKLFFNFEEKD
jgi:hypothetical protein